MRLFFAMFISVFLWSCGETGNTGEPGNSDTSSKSTPLLAAGFTCYMKVLKRDTMVACLIERDTVVMGKLTFDNFEKDASTGPVLGKSTVDTIKLWYNFDSEGTRSVMEVYFKKDGNNIVRGLGPVDVKGDTAYFTNRKAIQFKKEEVWQKVDCDSIALKYRCKQ